MRKVVALLLLAFVGIIFACSDDNANDGGADGASEAPFDICSTFTGVGESCAHPSTIVCFQFCEASTTTGCSCKAEDAGPTWECYTDPQCVNPCGNTSPESDSAPCDAEAGDDDAGFDASDDAADAGEDAGVDAG